MKGPDAIGSAISQSFPETILSVRRPRPCRNHCIAPQEAPPIFPFEHPDRGTEADLQGVWGSLPERALGVKVPVQPWDTPLLNPHLVLALRGQFLGRL